MSDLKDRVDAAIAAWEREMGIHGRHSTLNEHLARDCLRVELSMKLARSNILDAIKMRVRTMGEEHIHKAYEEIQRLVKTVAPHWYVYNAIVKEMDDGYRRGDTIERIVSQAMRRMQDGLLFNRWLGQK